MRSDEPLCVVEESACLQAQAGGKSDACGVHSPHDCTGSRTVPLCNPGDEALHLVQDAHEQLGAGRLRSASTEAVSWEHSAGKV